MSVNLPDNWFGATMQTRATIQQYCHWHASFLRRGVGTFFTPILLNAFGGNMTTLKKFQKVGVLWMIA